MSAVRESFESVAVSTRMRLARNFADYPFPGRLLKDAHAEEQAQEIVRLISASLSRIDQFTLYEMKHITAERTAFLLERNLISPRSFPPMRSSPSCSTRKITSANSIS